ncbi:MAG: GNAT family N-acetyltransferase [Ruminococcaceae bacterium]|nr:GNAT family N-acetyltransferase [Oscillospiraceae bacterium]
MERRLNFMIFEDKKIILKDGRTAILKSPCACDAEKLLNYIKKSCGETDFLARYPEEWEGATVESEEKWIQSRRNSRNVLVITCYIDGEIAGNCEINFKGGIKTSHRAGVAIAILKEYWNLGIGSAMFAELMSAAEARPETEIVELEFLEGNDRSRALYEKYGFRIVGERPNAFKLKDGRKQKEYFMQKDLRKK